MQVPANEGEWPSPQQAPDGSQDAPPRKMQRIGTQFGERVFNQEEKIEINQILAKKLAKDQIATRPGPGGSKCFVFFE
jgi:hypothetical protein